MEEQKAENKSTPVKGPLHIVTMPGHCGGKPHIAGHRIKVQHVAVWHEMDGKSPDEIVAEHPGLTLAGVYAALAYYHDHRDEIAADLKADADLETEMGSRGLPPKIVENSRVRVDSTGRVLLPFELRHEFGIEPGCELTVFADEEGIHLQTFTQAVRATQGTFATYRIEDNSIVDELIRERRAEAKKESRLPKWPPRA